MERDPLTISCKKLITHPEHTLFSKKTATNSLKQPSGNPSASVEEANKADQNGAFRNRGNDYVYRPSARRRRRDERSSGVVEGMVRSGSEREWGNVREMEAGGVRERPGNCETR